MALSQSFYGPPIDSVFNIVYPQSTYYTRTLYHRYSQYIAAPLCIRVFYLLSTQSEVLLFTSSSFGRAPPECCTRDGR